MEQSENLLSRINQQYSKLSKGQKRLASYIVDNYDKAVFLTAARLGNKVGALCHAAGIFRFPGVSQGAGGAGHQQTQFYTEDGSDLWKSAAGGNP